MNCRDCLCVTWLEVVLKDSFINSFIQITFQHVQNKIKNAGNEKLTMQVHFKHSSKDVINILKPFHSNFPLYVIHFNTLFHYIIPY